MILLIFIKVAFRGTKIICQTGKLRMKEDNYQSSIYKKFNSEDLILRDELAVDRTLLANERTLLAYLRSAVSLVIAGFTMMHFAMGSEWFWFAGVVSIPAGVLTGLVGIMRFGRMHRMISRIRFQARDEAVTGEIREHADTG
jgi:putative membrane protein